MIYKTKLSSIFRDVAVTDKFIQSMIGKPVKNKEKNIGVITAIDLEKDVLYMDIDDYHLAQFEKLCSFEIVLEN